MRWPEWEQVVMFPITLLRNDFDTVDQITFQQTHNRRTTMPKTLAEVETVSRTNHRDSIEAPVLSSMASTNNKKQGIVPDALVEVAGVSKSYHRNGTSIPVLENINLSVPEGEFLALMGPSGSGKSTLLNLIAGIDRPDTGSIIVANDDVTKLSESRLANWRAHHVGFIFQFYNLMPVLTAYENVELPLLLTKLSKKERDEHVKTALAVVGLSDRMKHHPKQLSGGQQQRVAIARAIVADPTLIVADEPTGDLDKNSAVEILTLLERLNQEFNKTILMVTHDQRAADKAHTVRHLDKGELV
jgi:putative ABC transport system ATP-binding protein